MAGRGPDEDAGAREAAVPPGGSVRRAAKSGGFVFLGLLGERATWLAFRLLATNLLGPGAYGLLALGTSVANVVSGLGKAGFDQAALRFGSELHGRGDRAGLARLARICLGVAVTAGSAVGAALFLLAGPIADAFAKPDLDAVLRVLGAGLPFFCLGTVAAAVLQSMHRMRMYILSWLLIPPAVACLAVGPALWNGWGLIAAVSAQALGWAVGGSAAAAVALRATSTGVRGEIGARERGGETDVEAAGAPTGASPVALGRVVRYALAMLVVFEGSQLVRQIDRLMLGALATSRDVGTFDVAANAAEYVLVFLVPLNLVTSPLVASLYHAQRRAELAVLYRTVTRWIVTLTLPLFMGAVALPGPILRLFGREFDEGAAVLVILAAAQLLNAGAGGVGVVLRMTDHERWVIANTLLLGALNAAGNYLLIPRYGIAGAAVSTAAALVIRNIASLVQVYFLVGIQPYDRAYLRPLGAAAAALAAGCGLGLLLPGGTVTSLACAGAALGVYFAVLVRMGLLPEDRPVWEAARRRLLGGAGRSAGDGGAMAGP